MSLPSSAGTVFSFAQYWETHASNVAEEYGTFHLG